MAHPDLQITPTIQAYVFDWLNWVPVPVLLSRQSVFDVPRDGASLAEWVSTRFSKGAHAPLHISAIYCTLRIFPSRFVLDSNEIPPQVPSRFPTINLPSTLIASILPRQKQHGNGPAHISSLSLSLNECLRVCHRAFVVLDLPPCLMLKKKKQKAQKTNKIICDTPGLLEATKFANVVAEQAPRAECALPLASVSKSVMDPTPRNAPFPTTPECCTLQLCSLIRGWISKSSFCQ